MLKIPRKRSADPKVLGTPHLSGARRGRRAEAGATSLALAVSPSGRLYLEKPGAAPERSAGDARFEAIEREFARGQGFGLLHLGAVEAGTHLPPSLACFRDLAHLYVSRLCSIPDLEETREQVRVPPPAEDLAALAVSLPPMTGAEYVDPRLLERLWADLETAFREEIRSFEGTVQGWLQRRNSLWNLVGRVWLHLAERKGDGSAPFAFLATYTTRISKQARVQHVPLGRALAESSGARNRNALLSLLLPIQRAAERSGFVKGLVDSGEIFHPLAWTPCEAYRFLREIPLLEESGVVVRVPDWWKARRGPRPEVRVTVGARPKAILGADSLLDFSVELTLDGETLPREEWERILAETDGLALVRGKWVEIDGERLREVLEHWKAVEKAAGRDGISFLEGMRLLAGAPIGTEEGEMPAGAADWSRVVAGDGLARALRDLRAPGAAAEADPGPDLRTELRPYQKTGVSWLRLLERLRLGGCLADDMGLGKTIQVLALLLLVKREPGRGPHLLVVPASLLANWKAEAERFAASLRLLVAHPSAIPSAELRDLPPARLAGVDAVITSYGTLLRVPWIAERTWDLAILDEAQAVKNPAARQTRAVKGLRSRVRFALTGTPVENRLSDLWSLFDFLCPGLLGSAGAFVGFAKSLERSAAPNPYAPLRDLVRPYILRRLKTDRTVVADLPDKTEVRAFCSLTRKQAALYQQAVARLATEIREREGIERRGLILASLLALKQICNHPSQWLGDGSYDPADSGKVARLREICEPIAARQEKALVFTQFREMTGPLATFLAEVFGRPGVVLHGGTPVRDRMDLVRRFQEDLGPPFFVLSLRTGGTGLNLTAASHVIHFDRWWNPAVENQATDRAHRIGQRKNVLVHKFVCRGTVEEKVDALIESKKDLAARVVEGGGEALLTELGDEELLRIVSLDIRTALAEE